MKIVISCFDKTTNMVKPWAEAGYLCYCVDIQHERGERREGNIIRVGADINYWIPPQGNIVFAAFFPPCTDLAVSGAGWFKQKGLHKLADAIKLFARCVDIASSLNCPWMIENPVSTISTYWRKPDYTFDPYEYAGYAGGETDLYTKKTCLWVGGGFVMPNKKEIGKPVVPPAGSHSQDILNERYPSRMHLLPPSVDRQELRSMTPAGFATAVFEANSEQVCASTY